MIVGITCRLLNVMDYSEAPLKEGTFLGGLRQRICCEQEFYRYTDEPHFKIDGYWSIEFGVAGHIVGRHQDWAR